MAKRSALGKGLDALLTSTEEPQRSIGTNVQISQLSPRQDQPRKNFDPEALEELAASIKEHGIIQPLLVVENGEESYEIVAGERRYRAAKLAGLKEVPVIVKDLTDDEVQVQSIIENVQREDLNPIEEAQAYRDLMDYHGMTQEEVGKTVGKSRSYIANLSRLINLEPEIQQHIIDGNISSSQGRTLLSIEDRDERMKVLQGFLDKKINIREAEERTRSKRTRASKDIYIIDIENRLTESLEAKVKLKPKAKGGQIVIDYYDNDDLARLIDILEEEK